MTPKKTINSYFLPSKPLCKAQVKAINIKGLWHPPLVMESHSNELRSVNHKIIEDGLNPALLRKSLSSKLVPYGFGAFSGISVSYYRLFVPRRKKPSLGANGEKVSARKKIGRVKVTEHSSPRRDPGSPIIYDNPSIPGAVRFCGEKGCKLSASF